MLVYLQNNLKYLFISNKIESIIKDLNGAHGVKYAHPVDTVGGSVYEGGSTSEGALPYKTLLTTRKIYKIPQ